MKEASKNNYDITIIGGGITGSTTSILLCRLGYKVALIEKTNLSAFKPGESLSPECKPYFSSFNFAFDDNIASEYFGNSSTWGDNNTIHEDLIFNPYGNGISVDRKLLEQKLVNQSSECGNTIFMQTSVLHFEFESGQWKLSLQQNNESFLIRCRLLIFATGRTSPLNPLGSKRDYFDKLLAITVITDFNPSTDRHLTIEALPDGWFYTNVLPGGKRVVSVFTDSDLIPASRSKFFYCQMRNTEFFREMNDLVYDDFSNPVVYDARTAWSGYQSGAYWLEIGDSAYAIDPLSGQGILKNFRMTGFVVENITSFFNGQNEMGQGYRNFNRKNFNIYISQQKDFYEMEHRWKNKPFWLRRHASKLEAANIR